MVYVVAKKSFGDIDNLAVHPNPLSPFGILGAMPADGV